MSWTFRKMSRAEMNADPVEGEFFTPEGLADALVREAIQNSLDARLGSAPVRVRFLLSGEGQALPAENASPYLTGLHDHLNEIEAGRSDTPAQNEPMPFLVIEDFGTRGLCGPPDQECDEVSSPEGSHNDFFYFWRNVGRSKKHETERGRWGLGKTVFPASSRINAFFGMTVRSEDNRTLLMGQSVLKMHSIGDAQFQPLRLLCRLVR